jgi:histidine decarboxylase
MIVKSLERVSTPSTMHHSHWRVLDQIEDRLRNGHANHLGYPYNLVGQNAAPPQFTDYLVNNLGDPYVGSHYGSEVCDLEREVVDWLMDLWRCATHEEYWGSVGASGTEGNLWALYLGREAFPQATLLYSAEAHYSIPKAARILSMRAQSIACEPSGAIDIAALKTTLSSIESSSVVLALTSGTTVKGAHDDIGAAIAALDAAGFGPERRFIHVDGALNAMVLPFVDEAPASLQPSFRHAIDSISTSGHKMIGTTMPCGVLVARRERVDRVASAVAYLRSNDTTLMGSRNGHAVVSLWSRLMGHGVEGFRRDVRLSLWRAALLARNLRAAGVPVLLNPYSLTVLFPQPAEEIVRKYQLACRDGEAHAIVMPSVSETLIARFTADYLAWWRRNP